MSSADSFTDSAFQSQIQLESVYCLYNYGLFKNFGKGAQIIGGPMANNFKRGGGGARAQRTCSTSLAYILHKNLIFAKIGTQIM